MIQTDLGGGGGPEVPIHQVVHRYPSGDRNRLHDLVGSSSIGPFRHHFLWGARP
jgi:hypothetical protein